MDEKEKRERFITLLMMHMEGAGHPESKKAYFDILNIYVSMFGDPYHGVVSDKIQLIRDLRRYKDLIE